MRVVKDAEERRNEILYAAEQLFGTKGFDGTSTNDILERVGIARGTLYYHFKSKEDIMDGLVDRINTNLINTTRAAASDRSVSLVECIMNTILSMNIGGGNNDRIIEHIHKPQNALMQQKIQKAMIQGIAPIMTELVQEGVEQKMFSTPFPYESVEMIMVYAITVFNSEVVEIAQEDMAARITAFIFNIERLLGAEEGSFNFITKMFDKEGI